MPEDRRTWSNRHGASQSRLLAKSGDLDDRPFWFSGKAGLKPCERQTTRDYSFEHSGKMSGGDGLVKLKGQGSGIEEREILLENRGDLPIRDRDDCTLLGELNDQLIREEGHRNQMNPEQLRDRMGKWLEREYCAAIFEEDRCVVGYALFREEQNEIYLRQLFSSRDQRRRGLGRRAMEILKNDIWPEEKTAHRGGFGIERGCGALLARGRIQRLCAHTGNHAAVAVAVVFSGFRQGVTVL